jgi:hypothetical protein
MDTDLERQLIKYGERKKTRDDYKEVAAYTDKQQDILAGLLQKVVYGQFEEVRLTAVVVFDVPSSGPAESRLRVAAILDKAAKYKDHLNQR